MNQITILTKNDGIVKIDIPENTNVEELQKELIEKYTTFIQI